ncbi:hypothetical protein Q1695_015978 [Nippostrongylus brasiliensis]|nr:hypothetical protein Q1695_015971 [Nippostrongylus brasiliensis]WKY02359.1 hypothetical protein Q1695_015978 [Nippostrongylus brasiliensis]
MRSVPLFLVVILAAQVLGFRYRSPARFRSYLRRNDYNRYRRNYNDYLSDFNLNQQDDDYRPMDFSPNWDDDDDYRPMDFSPNWDDDDDDDDDYNDFQYNQYNNYNRRRRAAMEFSGKEFTKMLAAAP